MSLSQAWRRHTKGLIAEILGRDPSSLASLCLCKGVRERGEEVTPADGVSDLLQPIDRPGRVFFVDALDCTEEKRPKIPGIERACMAAHVPVAIDDPLDMSHGLLCFRRCKWRIAQSPSYFDDFGPVCSIAYADQADEWLYDRTAE